MGYNLKGVSGTDYLFMDPFSVKKNDNYGMPMNTWQLVGQVKNSGPGGGGSYDPYAQPGYVGPSGVAVSGIRWEQMFPYMAPWAVLGSMKVLLHFDGIPGSEIIMDESGRTWVASSASITNIGPKFGVGCASLPTSLGPTGYVYTGFSSDLNFAKADFCIELFVKYDASSDMTKCELVRGYAGVTTREFTLDCGYPPVGDTGLRFSFMGMDDTQYTISGTWTEPQLLEGQWIHIALVRESLYFRLYLNGVNITDNSFKGGTIFAQPFDLALPNLGEAGSLFWVGKGKAV